jgi:hypothetical protein
MLRHGLYLGLASLGLALGSQGAFAETPGSDAASLASSAITPGATVSSTTVQAPPAPASISAQATPLPTTSSVTDGSASQGPKFYTFSAALREIYDTNIFTANTGKIASWETQFSPSVLFDFPKENSDFSVRETFTATYYSNRPGDVMDYTNEVVMAFQHSISDRFSFNVADQFRYYTEPSLFQNVGTLYYSGAYISNTFNGSFNAQWTPLVSTLFTYANTYIDYMNAATAVQNNSVENTGSVSLGFAILPKVTLTFNGIVDDIDYTQMTRGYTSLTASSGVIWQALPSLSFNVAAGGSTTTTSINTDTVTPYAAASMNWQLGARSAWTFSYSHSIVPTDESYAEGQIADRLDTVFRYDIIPDLSAHLEGTYTYGQYTNALISPNTIGAYTENDFAIDAGLTYHVNKYFDVNVGNIYSGVASGLSFRDYNRDQVYMGVRGTY